LERLAKVDHVVLDKTGTLTLGRPELVSEVDRDALQLAAGIAANSRHPLAIALRRRALDAPVASGVVEHPGRGLQWNGVRLGSAVFCGIGDAAAEDEHPELWLARPDHRAVRFAFA